LHPKWKGKIILTYPNDDDAILYLFTLIVQQYGWKWLDKLLEQDVQWVRGTATPGEIMLVNTNKTVSFTTSPPAAGWAYLPPVSDNYMSWAQSSAIFKDTKLPETAKLVQAFLISKAGQSIYLQEGLPSVRKDLAGGNGTIWDSSNTDYATFHQFMENRDTVEAWRFAFEDKIGTAQGLNPLIDDIF
jgi:ABC-type Fe3+ transport system substrate-binding protein